MTDDELRSLSEHNKTLLAELEENNDENERLKAQIVRLSDAVRVTDENVERLTRALYEDWPIKAISPALAERAGVAVGETLSWEQSLAMGAKPSGLRRHARAILLTLSKGHDDEQG